MQNTEQGINVHEFQQYILANQFDQALDILRQLVADFEHGFDYSRDISLDSIDPFIASIYTQIAFCLTRLLLSENFDIDDFRYQELILFSRDIAGIFLVSGFYQAGFILRTLQQRLNTQHLVDSNQPALTNKKTEQTVKRILLTYSLFIPDEFDLSYYLKHYPELARSALLALLSYPILIQAQAFQHRETLIDIATLLETQHPKKIHLSFMASGWMLCSYANRRDKHRLKKSINTLLKNWLHTNKVRPPKQTKQKSAKTKKPTLLLVIEYMTEKHAMYRCFADAISELQEKFNTVSLAEEGCMDETAQHLFHRNLSYAKETAQERHTPHTISNLFKTLQHLAADLIYYPSLGMRPIPIVLANYRLAPIQLASLGHPATTYSEAMDYMIVPKEVYHEGANDLFSEKIITVPMDTFTLLPASDLNKIQPTVRSHPDKINIIVSERSYKLNPNFMRVCQHISLHAKRQVVFHFFIGEVGLLYHMAKKEIIDYLPGAYVYPCCPIEDYIKLLASGDLCLATFPFGSTNGAVDAACLGLPIVNLMGDEMHSRYDGLLMQQLDMPRWLNSTTEKNYIEAAFKIIEDDSLRIELSETLIKNYRTHFRNQKASPKRFLDLFWQIYQKHNQLKKQGKNVIDMSELVKL